LDIDIFITGSNATLLSSDLSTYLAGRYIDFEILPFSYSEYL
jgi:predicted AAA+ superfamily ATPase